jgi:hypothetical protein
MSLFAFEQARIFNRDSGLLRETTEKIQFED